MKNLFLLSLIFLFTYHANSQTLNFTVINLTGGPGITCANASLNYSASSNHTAPVNYSWVSSTNTLTGANVQITAAGIYTVSATSGTLTTMQTFTVTSNTTPPPSTVTPMFLNIACSSTEAIYVTAMGSPTQNITHHILAPYGGTFIATTTTLNYAVGGPGTYTHVLIDNLTGCTTTTQFTVSATPGFPTFSLSSAQNYTLGCTTNSVVTVNIMNGSTSPVPGGPISYTLLGPGTSTAPGPGPFPPFNNFTITTPGNYTIVVRDNTSFCTVKIPITISAPSPSLFPNISLTATSAMLTCNSPTVLLQGSTTSTFAQTFWTSPGSNQVTNGQTVIATTNVSAPTTTIAGTYTFSAQHLTAGCTTRSTVTIYQNTFPPNAAISTGIGQGTLTCSIPSLALTNISSTGIPPSSGFPSNGPVVAAVWDGPPPATTLLMSTTYVATSGGVYTMTAEDTNNGCKSTATITVYDTRVFPSLSVPGGPFNLCGNPYIDIYAAVNPLLPSNIYTWTAPGNGIIGPLTTHSVTVNQPGSYTLTVKNAQGCGSTITILVVYCVGVMSAEQDLGLLISPNPGTGNYVIRSNAGQEKRQIRIYNSVGLLLLQHELLSDVETIDLRDYTNGIYLFVIENGNNPAHMSRIIKE